jgi:hypothetical protein
MALIRRFIRRLANILGGLLVIAALIVIFVRELQEYPQSAKWPPVPGSVVTSRAQSNEDGVSLDFQYEYIVDGRSYASDRYTFFEYIILNKDDQVYEIVEQYPAGSEVTVYYDPANPSKAIIKRTFQLADLESTILMALCLASVLIFAVMGFFLRLIYRVFLRSFVGLIRGMG